MSELSREHVQEIFVNAVNGYRTAKLLFVSTKLGFWDVLSASESMSGAQVAERLGLNPGAVASVLDNLVAMGLLVHTSDETADGYRCYEAAKSAFQQGSEGSLHQNLKLQDMFWSYWTDLEGYLRRGPERELEVLAHDESEFLETYIEGVQAVSEPRAYEVAQVLCPSEARRIVDVGGGGGTYSLALAQAAPRAQVTLLDLAPTLNITRRMIAGHPRAEQIRLCAGNYLKDDYGQDADLILMSNVTHDEPAESVRTMFSSAYRALKVGGRLAMHDWVIDPRSQTELIASLFSTTLKLYTRQGAIYSREFYQDMFQTAGFSEAKVHEIGTASKNPSWVFVATKIEE